MYDYVTNMFHLKEKCVAVNSGEVVDHTQASVSRGCIWLEVPFTHEYPLLKPRLVGTEKPTRVLTKNWFKTSGWKGTSSIDSVSFKLDMLHGMSRQQNGRCEFYSNNNGPRGNTTTSELSVYLDMLHPGICIADAMISKSQIALSAS